MREKKGKRRKGKEMRTPQPPPHSLLGHLTLMLSLLGTSRILFWDLFEFRVTSVENIKFRILRKFLALKTWYLALIYRAGGLYGRNLAMVV